MIEIKIILKFVLSVSIAICDCISFDGLPNTNKSIRSVKCGLFLVLYILWIFGF